MRVTTKTLSRCSSRRLAVPAAAATRSGGVSWASSMNLVLIIHSPLHRGAGSPQLFTDRADHASAIAVEAVGEVSCFLSVAPNPKPATLVGKRHSAVNN